MLDVKQIMKILPHRYPFLLVDKVEVVEERKKAVGLKNVTINEPFFQGHFPDFPVMPGVLIIEAMAQVAAVIFLKLPETEGKIAYFAGIDKVRFRRPVMPGDQLRIEAEVLKVKGLMGKAKGTVTVDGTVVTEGEIMFSVVDRNPGGPNIHPTAIVHSTAELAANVQIGPHVIIGPEVSIGEGTKIDAKTVISRWTKIGKHCHIYHDVVMGTPPQDARYKGEKSLIEIGDRNIIREYTSIHLATGEGEKTKIGNDNFIMAYAHVPHNCTIGNHTVIANLAGLCGHCNIGDEVVMGGMAGVHQFVRVGRLAMIGGKAKVIQDIPPFMLVDGNPAQIRGVNIVGLQRKGISLEAQGEIKKAYRILYRSGLVLSKAIEEIKKQLKPLDEIKFLLEFLEKGSPRGISRKIEEAEQEEAEELIIPEIPELGI